MLEDYAFRPFRPAIPTRVSQVALKSKPDWFHAVHVEWGTSRNGWAVNNSSPGAAFGPSELYLVPCMGERIVYADLQHRKPPLQLDSALFGTLLGREFGLQTAIDF